VDADFTAVPSPALVAAEPSDPVPVGLGVVVLQPAMARQRRISSSGGRHRCSGGRLGFIGCFLVPVVLPLECGPAAYGEARPFQAEGAYLRTRGLGPDFARLWTANAVSNLGDGVTLVAGPLLAASLTRDPRLVAGLAVAQRLP
jgi:hypothetical protein